jgi:hypothetical protein
MATAPIRQPAIQVVNSVGGVIGGPYLFNVGGGAQTTLGVVLNTIDAGEEAKVVGPWENFAWSTVSFPLGYKLHALMHFQAVESDPVSTSYGLTLLHRLWAYSIANQLTFAGLQFRMFTGATWRGVVVDGMQWQPVLMAGKQMFYEVDFSIVTRDLVPTPGEWAQSQW